MSQHPTVEGYIATLDGVCHGFGKTQQEAATLVKRAIQHYQQWVQASYQSQDSPVIIGGCGRSGTTLFRVIIDSHRTIACGTESELLLNYHIKYIHPNSPLLQCNQQKAQTLMDNFDCPPARFWELWRASSSYAQFVERFFRDYAVRMGKSRWGEKTPKNVVCLPWIFSHFPNAKFIHVIRDGRDVYCSLREHPKYKWVDGELVPTNILQPADYCIQRWVNDVQAGLQWRGHSNYMEIHYETLIESPRHVMETVLGFLSEPWDENVLRHHEADSPSHDLKYNQTSPKIQQPISTSYSGRWQQDMTEEDKRLFKQQAGDLLIKLGYASDYDW